MTTLHARAARWAWWLLPVVFLIWLYRDGFSTWFVADDFAWLSLLRLVQRRHDLLHELFVPMAQGTIRPWSERGYFLLLENFFGLDPVPFRVVAFATAAADLVLIAWIALRATGSRVAGFAAPVLWAANTALVRPMTWSSAYNELLCPLFLLGALALWIRWLDTGRRAFWWWQVVVFILGFGALEINIIYPPLAAAWVMFAVPGPKSAALKRLAPLAGVSVAYFAIHRMAAPLPSSGPYTLHFDASLLKTLVLYAKWAVAPEPMVRFGYSHAAAGFAAILGVVAIAVFAGAQVRAGKYFVLFCLAWFAVTLSPVLPLTVHLTDYYLTIPFIGIAMLGGAAIGWAWNRGGMQRLAVAIPVTVYLAVAVPTTLAVTHFWSVKSSSVRTLVLGVKAARQTHPGKAIVVDGVTTELYNLSLADAPFLSAGVDDFYLTAESGLKIKPDHGITDLDTLVLDPGVLLRGITHNDVVVYSLESDRLRNVTERYGKTLLSAEGSQVVDRLPARVDAGNFLYSWLLGPTWLSPESGIRWMPGRATLRLGMPPGLGVPPGSSPRLELEGHIPESQLLRLPPHLMVLVDGRVVGDTRIYDPETTFHRLYPIPADLVAGKASVEIEIRVDPVDRKDGQEYGVVFGKIAILP